MKRLTKILIILLITFFITLALGLVLIDYYIGEIISIVSLIFILFDFIFLLVSEHKRIYNMILILIPLALIGHSLKYFHLAGAGVILSIAYSTAAITCYIVAFKAFTILKDNVFLKRLTISINVILSIVFVGTLFKMQHWPGGGIVIIIGIVLFIISLIALVFTLPSSNFIDWTKLDKKFFYRTILIPSIYIFIFFAAKFAFGDVFTSERKIPSPVYVYPIELLNKEGINE